MPRARLAVRGRQCGRCTGDMVLSVRADRSDHRAQGLAAVYAKGSVMREDHQHEGGIVSGETSVADFCTVEFCEHGHMAIRLFWDWRRETPFAAAFLGEESVAMI